MRDTRKNYVIVGTFLLAMLAALVGWLMVLSGRTGATDPYYIEFENVMGLAEGAEILYGGYPVGHIEEISLIRAQDGSAYRLDVSIRKGWKIPEDSVAVITQSGFLAPVVVDILEGRSTRILASGARIPSQRTTNFMAALTKMSSTLGELTETSLKPLLANLTQGTDSLDAMFEDIPVIMENVKTLTAQINDTASRLDGLLDRSGGRVDTILADMEDISGNVSTLAADLRETRRKIDTLLVSMNDLISDNREDIDQSVKDMNHILQVIASHVREISYNVEATTRNMNEFTADIRRDPGLIIRGRGYNEDLAAGE